MLPVRRPIALAAMSFGSRSRKSNSGKHVAHSPGLAAREALLLAVVLVAAFHAIPGWVLDFFPTATTREWYQRLGRNTFLTLLDAVSGIMPLILCLSAPSRSGLRIGRWHGRAWKVVGICVVPVILTAAVYPFTSKPFQGSPTGTWLVAPAAQDLLFSGYLYGVFKSVFPGRVFRKINLLRAIPITAAFFVLWHVPNFAGLPAAYVVFQLTYVFIGGVWVMLTRQMTGSIWPGVLTHMAVNYVSCQGW